MAICELGPIWMAWTDFSLPAWNAGGSERISGRQALSSESKNRSNASNETLPPILQQDMQQRRKSLSITVSGWPGL